MVGEAGGPSPPSLQPEVETACSGLHLPKFLDYTAHVGALGEAPARPKLFRGQSHYEAERSTALEGC